MQTQRARHLTSVTFSKAFILQGQNRHELNPRIFAKNLALYSLLFQLYSLLPIPAPNIEAKSQKMSKNESLLKNQGV